MDDYTIRLMRGQDAEEMSLIEEQIFSHPWTKDNFLESFELENTVYLVAEQKLTGRVLGYCGCYQSFDEGNISNVAVAPAARRRGIADAMLTELLRIGVEAGIRTFSLEVRVSNEPARALYVGHGFESVGIRRGFYEAPKEDADIMLLHADSNSHYPAG